MERGNIGEAFEKALSGSDKFSEADISKKIIIVSFLSMHPCSTSTAIARFLNTSERGVMWHLDGLMKKGIAGKYERKKARFFIKGHVKEGDCPIFSLLYDDKVRDIILILGESPGMSQSEILTETTLSRPVLKRLLRSLEEEGLIKAVKEGRNRRYYLTEKLGSIREEYARRKESTAILLKDMLSQLTGRFEIILERGALLHISLGKEEILLSTDPFESAFRG